MRQYAGLTGGAGGHALDDVMTSAYRSASDIMIRTLALREATEFHASVLGLRVAHLAAAVRTVIQAARTTI